MTMYEQAKADGTIYTCSNGAEVWPVQTRFGRLWTYGNGKLAWKIKAEAISRALRKS